MTLFAISGLSVFISCVILSVIALYFGKTKTHRLLFLFNIVVAVFGFGIFLAGIAKNELQALLAWKVAHLGGFIIGPSFYYLVSSICDIDRKKTIYFGYLLGFVFILLTFGTNLIFNELILINNIYFHKLNLLYFLGLLFYLIFVLLSYYELAKAFKTSTGNKHSQIRYIMFGFLIGFIGGTSTFLPLFGINAIYSFSNFGITIYVFILTFAIFRYRIMDIYFVFRKTIIYSLSAGLLSGIFVILIMNATEYLSEITRISSVNIIIISVFLITLLFDPLKNMIQSFIDRLFYKTSFDYYKVVQDVSRSLVSSIDLKYIQDFLLDTLIETLKLKDIYLYSTANESFSVISSRVSGSKKNIHGKINNIRIDPDSEIIRFIKNKKNILVKENLLTEIKNNDKLTEELNLFNKEVIIPVFIDNNIVYMIVLGEKLSGDFFSSEDVNLLETISNEASVALKNARLYEKLEILVFQRTKELSETNRNLQKEISIRKETEKQLKHQAYYDSLTNLPNRSLFMEHLKSVISYKERNKDSFFAVFLMDVDRFKVVNDSLGHLAGDKLLIMLSDRFKKYIRNVDIISRFGGDEFALLGMDIKNDEGIHTLANRIHEIFKSPFIIYDNEVYVSVSIGIISCRVANYKDPDDFLKDADIALYIAKDKGKACHVIFDPKMHAKADTILKIESDLRRAIEHNEFRINYQPLLSIDNNKIIGFEALVRWEHPHRGMLLPAEFLSIAEETGLIIDIDRWMLSKALKQMKEWRNNYKDTDELTISLNLSNKMLFHANFVDFIKNTLKETEQDGKYLRFEITEKIIIDNPRTIINIISELRNMGIKLDIDDFGTGHSSLNYIMQFPIDGLKIDKSFVSSLHENKNNEEIVKTIINMAKILKMDVIAEGIETEVQLDIFKKLNGILAQGYFFSKPMDKEHIEDIYFREKRDK